MKNNTYKLDRDKFSVPIDLRPQFRVHFHTSAACQHDSRRLCVNGQIEHCLEINYVIIYIYRTKNFVGKREKVRPKRKTK